RRRGLPEVARSSSAATLAARPNRVVGDAAERRQGRRHMKLGMNLLLWSTDVSGWEFDAVFAMLKDVGFDGVEIPIFDREIDAYAELGRRLDELGLERLAVAARGPDDNPI